MRYKLIISYDGTNYCGFQKQKNPNTVQEILENALCKVLKSNVSLVASGRTDAGVSAIEQVCHMDYDNAIDNKKFLGYANSILPSDIRILDIDMIDNGFHARYSAKRKTYEYLFYVGKTHIPVYDNIASNIGYNVNLEDMKRACKEFLGEHDFSAFCASNTNVKDMTRTIYAIDIINVEDQLYKLVVTGNGFLYNMVRIIMGTLIEVGIGKKSYMDIAEIIKSKDRNKAGKTAEAKGLYLKKVEY